MISFTRASLTRLAIHDVGNKGSGEELTCSKKEIQIKDDFLKDTLTRYFSSSFTTDIYHQFKTKADASLSSVRKSSKAIFDDPSCLMEESAEMARLLYDQSMHPKIKGGEFYTCYFKDVIVDGELCDAIGLFKTENKETYLKVYQHLNEFELDYENGISIRKIDKGCLVFNTDRKNGYKLSVVDNNKAGIECALYWEEDFLQSTLKTGAYYHTRNFMDASRGFCEEVLTEENQVSKEDQRMMLNRSTAYFKEKDKFQMKDFEEQVLTQPELVQAFRDYRQDFNKRLDLTAVDDFEISPTAVKKYQKYMRSVIKLDKNFHIYIHGRHDYVEKGYDEEKKLKFYKLYYVNED
ncbi:MAG TPA: nucleoid-associated protein [Bacteroidia bacterium]|nr:nucleoid-associated protein [Bacteroidia bacterium]